MRVKTPKQRPTKNRTISIAEATDMRLARLRHKTGSASDTETIRRALEVYEMMVDAYRGGSKIYLQSEGAIPTLVIIT
jgi:hypothetical protein